MQPRSVGGMSQPTNSSQRVVQEQILDEFRTWMLGLSEDDLARLGVDFSVEESLRLLRGFAATKGLSHAPQTVHINI
jgi:hypothetical protein